MAETTAEHADIITVKDLQTGIVKYPRTVTRAIIDDITGTILSDQISVIESDVRENSENFNNYYTSEEVDVKMEFCIKGKAVSDPTSILD